MLPAHVSRRRIPSSGLHAFIARPPEGTRRGSFRCSAKYIVEHKSVASAHSANETTPKRDGAKELRRADCLTAREAAEFAFRFICARDRRARAVTEQRYVAVVYVAVATAGGHRTDTVGEEVRRGVSRWSKSGGGDAAAVATDDSRLAAALGSTD